MRNERMEERLRKECQKLTSLVDGLAAVETFPKPLLQSIRLQVEEIERLSLGALSDRPTQDVSIQSNQPVETVQPIQPSETIAWTSMIGLNDRFCFQRELFHGDTQRMHEVIGSMERCKSIQEATALLTSECPDWKESECVAACQMLLERLFPN